MHFFSTCDHWYHRDNKNEKRIRFFKHKTIIEEGVYMYLNFKLMLMQFFFSVLTFYHDESKPRWRIVKRGFFFKYCYLSDFFNLSPCHLFGACTQVKRVWRGNRRYDLAHFFACDATFMLLDRGIYWLSS